MPSGDREALPEVAKKNAPSASLFGGYRLVRMLGCGGMAEVWSGEEVGGRPVALKRILPHLCDDLAIVEMFLSEARLATLLKHPNVVRTYEVGILQRQPFIAMELVSGVDLRKLSAASTDPLPIGFCLAVAIQICDALAYVHAARDRDGSALGLIHRDISHSNIMLTRQGGVAKLLDFGVAKAALTSGLQRTRTGELKGKLGYMAPELLKEERYDHRADLFSVGVVLYELLVLQRLFKASTEASMLMMNLRCDVSAPSKLRPELTAALDGVVLRALSADPERRYGNAGEMADALRALARDYRWTAAQTVALIAARMPTQAEALEPTVPALPAHAVAPSSSSSRAVATHTETRLTPASARRPRWLPITVAFVSATALMMLVLFVGRGTHPADAWKTSEARHAALEVDPWATPPRLDVVSSRELTLPLPGAGTAAVAPPTVPAAEPTVTAEPPPPPNVPSAVKRPPVAVRPSEPRDAHRPATTATTTHHRHKATETLMGQKELMNPLAQ
jgi:eukaryotic-like serine/threonine-protein kinase